MISLTEDHKIVMRVSTNLDEDVKDYVKVATVDKHVSDEPPDLRVKS